MRMTAIQTKAVRNSSRRMMVLGSTNACTPPSSSNSSRAHTREPGKPKSGSSWY